MDKSDYKKIVIRAVLGIFVLLIALLLVNCGGAKAPKETILKQEESVPGGISGTGHDEECSKEKRESQTCE